MRYRELQRKITSVGPQQPHLLHRSTKHNSHFESLLLMPKCADLFLALRASQTLSSRPGAFFTEGHRHSQANVSMGFYGFFSCQRTIAISISGSSHAKTTQSHLDFQKKTKSLGVKVKKCQWQAWVTRLPTTRGQHMFPSSQKHSQYKQANS